ncbi:MAG: phosphoglycerate kinase [Desulfonatronovibrionaceae bacterium]
MRFLKDIDVQGKRLLVRVDYNVPVREGVITDDSRIKAGLPTLNYALENGASIILCSHMGKPGGRRDKTLSLAPVASRVSELLGREVKMAPDCIGPEVREMAGDLEPGEVMLLENLRFHPGEKENDPQFSRELAELADVYVNDAFGVAHRAHASVVGTAEMSKIACAGILLQKEWEYLNKAMENPERPFVAVSGGAKVSSKLGILKNLLGRVDCLIVGGAMANTFLTSLGYDMGGSLVETDLLEEARSILKKAREKDVEFYLPVDFICGRSPGDELGSGVRPYQNIPAEEMALDIGPASYTLFSEVVSRAGTIVWNGPMGAFENPQFAQGSLNMARSIAFAGALTIVGGGDTNALVYDTDYAERFSFISTGGGSFLEFLEGRELPAFKALKGGG